jgi:hypothetical protein
MGSFMSILYILEPIGTICHYYLVYFSRFGMSYRDESGNPVTGFYVVLVRSTYAEFVHIFFRVVCDGLMK